MPARAHATRCGRILRLAALTCGALCPIVDVVAAPHGLSSQVYLAERANEAREVAQRDCKPLVVHVVPNSSVGVQEVIDFYRPGGNMPQDVLDRVVIVILPRDRYSRFAVELGITDAGGMRTISPYSLDTLDAASVTTCRAGFV